MSLHEEIKAKARKALEGFIRSGMKSKEALERVQNEYLDDVVDVMSNEINSLKIGFISPTKLKKMAVGDIDLSTNLYRHIDDVNANVMRVISEHSKELNNAQELALKIFEGYDFKDDPLKVKKGLPKYLFDPLAELQSKKLKTPALKAAYMQTLKAKNQQQLERTLETAMYERNRYFANRIAQTELHRIHTHDKVKQIIEDDGVEVVQIKLSATHPKVDICDYHANLDAYGLGPGCYPKDKAPMAPFHPFCRCIVSSRIDLLLSDAKPTKDNPETTLMRSFSEGDQVNILGTKGMHAKWKKGGSVIDLVNRTKKPLYRTKYSGEFSGRAIIPDMEGNELMSPLNSDAGKIPRMKSSAKISDGQNTWKSHEGLIDVRKETKLLSPDPGMLSKGETRADALQIFKEAIGISAGVAVIKSPAGEVVFSDEKLYHYVEKVDAARERFSNYVVNTVIDPYEVWLADYDDGSQRNIFIGLFEGEHDFLVTTWVDDKGSMFWNAMQVKKKKNYLNNQRVGEMVFKKGK